MARFILDVAVEEGIEKVLKACCDENLMGGSVTITCIDETTDNQFYIDDEEAGYSYTDNKLSEKQITNYNNFLKEK